MIVAVSLGILSYIMLGLHKFGPSIIERFAKGRTTKLLSRIQEGQLPSSEFSSILRDITACGVPFYHPLWTWPKGKTCFSYFSYLPNEKNVARSLETFSSDFGVTFVPADHEKAALVFLPMTMGDPKILQEENCPLGYVIFQDTGYVRRSAHIYLRDTDSSTIKHELIHALTPIVHITSNPSIMNPEQFHEILWVSDTEPHDLGPRRILTKQDKELVAFFLHFPTLEPGRSVEQALLDVEVWRLL